MLSQNTIKSLTVTIMEVPCCRGMAMMAEQALKQSGKEIPFEVVVIGVNGERKA